MIFPAFKSWYRAVTALEPHIPNLESQTNVIIFNPGATMIALDQPMSSVSYQNPLFFVHPFLEQ